MIKNSESFRDETKTFQGNLGQGSREGIFRSKCEVMNFS